MRVISQDGTIDVPYEISSLSMRLFIATTLRQQWEQKWLNTVPKKRR